MLDDIAGEKQRRRMQSRIISGVDKKATRAKTDTNKMRLARFIWGHIWGHISK